MTIRIITDSTTEITQQQARELNIDVVPLLTIFDEQIFIDGVDITPEQFYTRLADAKKPPTTSQPSPSDFERVFQKAIASGEQIIVLCIASTLSGTMQSAQIAKENCGGDIWIIDSETTTLSLQILVHRAIELRDRGLSAEEIVNQIEQEKTSISLFAAVDTLEYLYRGGRLSKVSALTGTLLNVKPMLTLERGVIKMIGKYLGIKKAYLAIIRAVESAGGIDFTRPFALGYSGSRDRFEQFERACQVILADHKPHIICLGSVLGTHVGPGAVAVSFFRN